MDNETPYSLKHCKDIVEDVFFRAERDGVSGKLQMIKALREAYRAGVTDTKVAWFDSQLNK
jgi:hypothetical protein